MQFHEFQKQYPLPENVFQKLATYHDLLVKWQKSVNLISPNTVNEIWPRHIFDSLQLMKHFTGSETIVDIGSGAGFPGMVLAICGAGELSLIESDRKKCEFLKEVARRVDVKVEVINARAENSAERKFDIIVSRATAPLALLFEWSQPLMHNASICLFHKGENSDKELSEAQKSWKFEVEVLPSESNATGCIIKATNVRNVNDTMRVIG